jgi:hypothetical protein
MLDVAEIPSAIWQRLSASLMPGDSVLTWRGKVDRVSIDQGIDGWALDLQAPQTPLRIKLLAGDQVIAETTSGMARPDVAALLGAEARPGFQFAAECLLHLSPEYAASPLRVVLADEPVEILADAMLPSVEQLLTADPVREVGFDLFDRLGVLRNAAEATADQPLRAAAAKEIGYVELLSIDGGGVVWVQGWMLRATVVDSPAVIVDGSKEPAAFAATFFERDDLDSLRCGFVGALFSAWTPTSSTTPVIFLKTRELMFLRCVSPPRIMKHEEFAGSFRKLSARCHTGPTAALVRLMDNPDSWTPMESQTQTAIERALIIPGFGCIIGGWALNPLHTPNRFSLRFGTTILNADEDSIVFSARPDLAAAAAGCDELLTRAGFVAVLRGNVNPREIDRPVLKIIYEGGMTTRHAIEPGVFRSVGTAASPETILSFYPSLYSEPFFEELALALRNADRSHADAWRFLASTPCTRAVVSVLSGSRSSAYLLSEQLRVHCADQKSVGVVLIADQGAIRSDALSLRASLVRESGISCSLVSAQRPTQALYALDSVLEALGCERFVFLGPGIFLTESGWESAFEYLHAADQFGCFFAVNDPAAESTESDESMQCAAAFGWRREALSSWLRSAPAILGGHAGDNGLALEPFMEYPGAAWYTRALDGSAFVQAVNRVTQ